MVPAQRCGRLHAVAINAVPGPHGSNSAGAAMSRRSRWPTRMRECCGPYSAEAKVIEGHHVPHAWPRLLVERKASTGESSIRSEYKVPVSMSKLSDSRSAGPPLRYARSALAEAALDRGPALRLWAITQSRCDCCTVQPFHTRRATACIESAVTSQRLRRPNWRAAWRTGRTGTFQTCRWFRAVNKRPWI